MFFVFFHFPSYMDATSHKCTATFSRVRNLLWVSTHQNVLNANDVIVFGLSNELSNTFANATALPMHTNQHMEPLSLKKSSFTLLENLMHICIHKSPFGAGWIAGPLYVDQVGWFTRGCGRWAGRKGLLQVNKKGQAWLVAIGRKYWLN